MVDGRRQIVLVLASFIIIGELQQRNLSLQEQVKHLNQQVQQQNINLQQLQELTNMLQESHR